MKTYSIKVLVLRKKCSITHVTNICGALWGSSGVQNDVIYPMSTPGSWASAWVVNAPEITQLTSSGEQGFLLLTSYSNLRLLVAGDDICLSQHSSFKFLSWENKRCWFNEGKRGQERAQERKCGRRREMPCPCAYLKNVVLWCTGVWRENGGFVALTNQLETTS